MNEVPNNNSSLNSRLGKSACPPELAQSLQRQLLGISKALRRAGDKCERIATPFRQHLQQFIELALIEVNEGMKVLAGWPQNDPAAVSASTQIESDRPNVSYCPTLENLNEIAENISAPKYINQHVAVPLDLSQSGSLNTIDSHLATGANARDIPEASDLQAILENLRASQQVDADGFDAESPTSHCGHSGFDVLKFDATQLPPTCGGESELRQQFHTLRQDSNGTVASRVTAPARGDISKEALFGPGAQPFSQAPLPVETSLDHATGLPQSAKRRESLVSVVLSDENLSELTALRAELHQIIQDCKQTQAPPERDAQSTPRSNSGATT